jgi:uncharacterized integral membrane protein (TIGR00698 family)
MRHRGLTGLAPGILLCIAVTAAAMALELAQTRLLGRVWLEPLVLAILLGTLVRTALPLSPRFEPGIGFSARILLEVAIVLLGFSLSGATILAVGGALLAGIAGVVALAVLASYAIGRALGLRRRMAVLVACGNSICGNSAIAAVAPVIGAGAEDIAAAIAFTAVLGVIVVLGLPLAATAIGLSAAQSGVFAGLTVYAVPQVLAAAAPVGTLAVQVGTLVKLVRVLMLGPVVLVLSLLAGRLAEPGEARPAAARPPLRRLLPWFILGFAGAIALRSAGLVPAASLPPIAAAAGMLTTISMAALGLGVDVRVVARAGARVSAAVTMSLVTLAAISLGLILVLGHL